MKIKDFLKLYSEESCFINVYDASTYQTKTYHYIQDVVRDYGYFPVVSWKLELSSLRIETRTEF